MVQGPHEDQDDHEREDGAVDDYAHPHPHQDDVLVARPRPFLQDAWLSGLHAQRDGRRQVRDQDEEEDLHGGPHEREGGHHAEEDLHDLGDVYGHDEGHELLDARVDDAPFLDRAHDGDEVVVRQDHVGGALGDLRALDPHRHTDLRRIQGRGVIDAVAGHRAHLALALQGPHDLELVLRLRAREDAHLPAHAVYRGVGDVVLAVGAERAAVDGLALVI
mmetsp:Transcript_76038/g.215479  ORF Transcript_76038/g.215479 Transcript_76038/m.215479 type:complete len:219 (-) Transcript_76038:320-976(-)